MQSHLAGYSVLLCTKSLSVRQEQVYYVILPPEEAQGWEVKHGGGVRSCIKVILVHGSWGPGLQYMHNKYLKLKLEVQTNAFAANIS